MKFTDPQHLLIALGAIYVLFRKSDRTLLNYKIPLASVIIIRAITNRNMDIPCFYFRGKPNENVEVCVVMIKEPVSAACSDMAYKYSSAVCVILFTYFALIPGNILQLYY